MYASLYLHLCLQKKTSICRYKLIRYDDFSDRVLTDCNQYTNYLFFQTWATPNIFQHIILSYIIQIKYSENYRQRYLAEKWLSIVFRIKFKLKIRLMRLSAIYSLFFGFQFKCTFCQKTIPALLDWFRWALTASCTYLHVDTFILYSKNYLRMAKYILVTYPSYYTLVSSTEYMLFNRNCMNKLCKQLLCSHIPSSPYL